MLKREAYLKHLESCKSILAKVKQDPYRLHYHLMPPMGWLNDPNGLCQKDGIYHIYYQYSPFDVQGVEKVWGHYTTKDFVSYDDEEPFLYPDTARDRNGVYSGSAFVENGEIYYFYTGNVKNLDWPDCDYIYAGREQNVMRVTSHEGWQASQKQCLLRNEDYPQKMTKHVRDPKVFKKNGHYYMILGARTLKGVGCAVLYESEDLEH